MAKSKVMHYKHADDKRSNIPTVSIAGQGSIPSAPKRKYYSNPHLSPMLRFDPVALNIHERISTHALPWVEVPPEERRPWDNCVPLTSLKAAAGLLGKEQSLR